jgi:2-oxoisovalerate dehydrogenase E1 component
MLSQELLLKAYQLMYSASTMAVTYDQNRTVCPYVHSTSRGHEAIQVATALNLLPIDFVSPYYRDDALLLALGYSPYQLMLQLLAKSEDPFTGGRSYYAHANNKDPDKPVIIHQSSATGMQVIPTTGIAQGLSFLEKTGSAKLRKGDNGEYPVVVCSLGDGSVTEGEVSEAFQFAVLKKLPVIYLVQDNNWGISASSKETRVMDAYEYVSGFAGMNRVKVNGSEFIESYRTMQEIIQRVRYDRSPYLVHANVPLLGHHTSGVRKEFYRTTEDLSMHATNDPLPKFRKVLEDNGIAETLILEKEQQAKLQVAQDFKMALEAPDPDPSTVADHIFSPTPITTESGERVPADAKRVLMVDAALIAIREIMDDNPEAILFGQDVGKRLGGVFREAATLADMFGEHRVFNTAIQEAYIIGSTAGLSATGVKPIVEVQFADYIYPGLNQLVCEIAKSCYLTCGRFPVQTVIRVPVGAYGGGGPYHSGSIETTLLSIKGVKIVYPSNAADMKGLFKAAFHDPNPVILLEHKGLYWSRIPGTEEAKAPEPSRDYIIPLGKATIALEASPEKISGGESCCVITYGMGVYWAKEAAADFEGRVEVLDLRTLNPLDEEMIYARVQLHGRCLVLTEEQQTNSFAEALAGRISLYCFKWLDAPVEVFGALSNPAVPINIGLEKAMLPDKEKVSSRLGRLLAF